MSLKFKIPNNFLHSFACLLALLMTIKTTVVCQSSTYLRDTDMRLMDTKQPHLSTGRRKEKLTRKVYHIFYIWIKYLAVMTVVC